MGMAEHQDLSKNVFWLKNWGKRPDLFNREKIITYSIRLIIKTSDF